MTKPIIDKALNLRLANYHPELARDVLHMLCDNLPHDLEHIALALKQHDLDTAKTATHKLHGAICYCGVPRLQDAISTFEKTLYQSHDAKMQQQLTLLQEEADKLIAAVASIE